jgi:transposase
VQQQPLKWGKTYLCKWKKALSSEGEEAFRGKGNRTAVEEENRRLRLELKTTREEVEILKKASAYFAKHVR